MARRSRRSQLAWRDSSRGCRPVLWLTLVLAGLACGRAGRVFAACPPENIPGFDAVLTSCGNVTSQTLSWNPPPGAGAGTIYEVLRSSFYPDYCAVPADQPSRNYTVIATTDQTSFTMSSLPLDEVFAVFVRLKNCSSVSDTKVLDTFTQSPAKPSLSAVLTGPTEVTLTYSHADGMTFDVNYLIRNGSLVSGFDSTFQNYCPAGDKKVHVDTLPGPGTYTYYISLYPNASVCYNVGLGRRSDTVTVTLSPPPTATVSGSATICSGASTDIQATLTGASPWSLDWSDGFTQSNVTSSPATRSVFPSSTTTYTVTTVSNASGSGPGSGSAVITVNAKPQAAASGAATICAGASTPLTGSGGVACSWSPAAGLSNASSCAPSATPSATTTYTLTVTGANCCTSTNNPSVTVIIKPKPATPVITAPASATPGQAGLAASVAAHAGSSYAWTVTNGTLTAGNGTNAITFTAGSSGSVVLACVETSNLGCASDQASKTVPINASGLPTAAVTGGATICPGASAIIQAALGGTSPWNVTWSDGVVQTGVASSPASRTVSPATSTTYTVTTVSNSSGSAAGTGSAAITIRTRPTAVASGTASICVGSSTALNGSGGVSCLWSPAAGLSSATSCSPSASPSATTTYALTVTDASGCTSSNVASITVTVNPKPATPVITAPASATPGQTGLAASVAAHAGASYAWSVTNGTLTAGNGTNAITFSAGASGSVVLSCIETSLGCASPQASKAVPISTSGLPTATVTGGATICSGASAVIQAALTGTSPWNVTWSDGVVQSGVASSPASRTVSPASSTTYTVTTVSSSSGSAAGTGSAAITVRTNPTAVASGTASICVGSSTALGGSGGVSCLWSPAAGLSSATSCSPSASPSATTTYSLTVTESSGCTSSNVATATVTLSTKPALPVITAPALANPGQTGLTASATLHGGSVYSWTVTNGILTSAADGSAVTFTAGASGVVTLTVIETSAAGCASAPASATVPVVGSSCPAPGAPVLSTPAATVKSGQGVALAWTAAPGLGAGGGYELESSSDGFRTIDSTLATAARSAVVSTEVSGTDSALSFRVRAAQACGTDGPVSNVIDVRLTGAPASFVFTQEGPSWTANRDDPPPMAEVRLRNVGGVAGRLFFSAIGGFFSVAPTIADVGPGQDVAVTVEPFPSAMGVVGVSTGLLVADDGASRLYTPVSLTVAPSAPKATVTASVSSLLFQALSTENPAPQTITLTVQTAAVGPVYLSPSIGPGGGWLKLGNELAAPFYAGIPRSLTVGVDRAFRTPQDGPPPLRTLLTITPVGGDPTADAAIVDVVDADLVIIGSGGRHARREPLAAAPPGGSSFVVPSAVKAVSGVTGQTFTSDGWLRNLSGATVPIDLYFTPHDMDGTADVGTLKAGLSLPAGGTFRLADLLASVFRTANTSGQMEVRSPFAYALTLRTSVDSIKGSDARTRFGTEIPTVAFGSGAALDDGELAIPGIDEDTGNRANLIVAETSGASAEIAITVYAPSGLSLGTLTRGVPAYGQIQINRIVSAVVPGGTLSGGWVGVRVTAGAGRVAAVATVIDNASGSFSAVLGKTPRAQGARYVVPSAVRLTGANNTRFSTRLSLVNTTESAAALTLRYTYYDGDDGNAQKTASAAALIPARGALTKELGEDVIASLFGVTNRSFGFFTLEGDDGGVTAVASVRAQVDPNDASKGFYTAQVDGLPDDSPDVLAGSAERTFAGAEEGRLKRTALVLLELDGQSCLVRVTAYTRSGARLGEKIFDVGPRQYVQVNRVLVSDGGLRLGAGPFQDVELRARIVGGSGRVLAFATVNDNVSRNPEVFVLKGAGPPAR